MGDGNQHDDDSIGLCCVRLMMASGEIMGENCVHNYQNIINNLLHLLNTCTFIVVACIALW